MEPGWLSNGIGPSLASETAKERRPMTLSLCIWLGEKSPPGTNTSTSVIRWMQSPEVFATFAGSMFFPHAAVVAGLYAEAVVARRQIRVEGLAAVPGLLPIAVKPIQHVAKQDFFRLDEAQRRVVNSSGHEARRARRWILRLRRRTTRPGGSVRRAWLPFLYWSGRSFNYGCGRRPLKCDNADCPRIARYAAAE